MTLLLAHHCQDITLGNVEIFSLFNITTITKEFNLLSVGVHVIIYFGTQALLKRSFLCNTFKRTKSSLKLQTHFETSSTPGCRFRGQEDGKSRLSSPVSVLLL